MRIPYWRCAVGADAETFPCAIDSALPRGKRLSRQNSRKVSIEIWKIFFKARPAHITIRMDQHVLAIAAAIRCSKMAESIHVNFGAVVRILRGTHIDAFDPTLFSAAPPSSIKCKQPQQGKVRTAKNIEQPCRLALCVQTWASGALSPAITLRSIPPQFRLRDISLYVMPS
jgi:hypothetical protein